MAKKKISKANDLPLNPELADAVEAASLSDAPPATETSLPLVALRARSSAFSKPSVTNVNELQPSRWSGSRAWCVNTNTG